ncbi:DUF456 domain-containing protein [Silvimonas iriomotensis]|uniref:Membrane protein n=1 Tax=Silvimonas iriomotensis TaxID=449662 RepID=A0ABQ2PC34_9NEIS|nr:DUF456 family protein [Silvimonas iriomotensis]GGP22883.1 membrane protein [Silvimonas iriomotensis]
MSETLLADGNIWWWVVAIALMLTGLVGTVFPLLPGTPFLFFGMLVAAWIDGFTRVGYITLGILLLLMLFSALLDWMASALGAKHAGASKQAVSGALLGSIVGMFFGIPGLILGPFIGAVAGELYARRGIVQAGKAGVATWLGLVLGAIAKVAIALMMLGLFLSVWWFNHP